MHPPPCAIETINTANAAIMMFRREHAMHMIQMKVGGQNMIRSEHYLNYDSFAVVRLGTLFPPRTPEEALLAAAQASAKDSLRRGGKASTGEVSRRARYTGGACHILIRTSLARVFVCVLLWTGVVQTARHGRGTLIVLAYI